MILFKNISYFNRNYEWIQNVDIIVETPLIKSITPSANRPEIEPRQFEQIIDGKNKLLIPGFFNLHSHVPMTLLRGYGEGLNLQDWLFTRIFPFEALLTEEDMYYGTLLGISEFLSCGTVSFTDMYMKLSGIIKAVAESGIKANLCNAAVGLDPAMKFEDNSSYQDEMYLLDYVDANKATSIRPEAGIHAEYTSSPALVKQVLEFSQKYHLALQIHISETEREHEECKARHGGKTPIEYFNDLGVLDQKCILAHGVYLSENDLKIIKEKNASIVHNPASNLKLGSGFANISNWLSHDINVCIGTDGAASNNDLDLIYDLRLAGLLSNGLHRDSNSITPEQLLSMATINGARAQNREKTGIIEVGNFADLVVVDLDAENLQPIYNLPATLIYSLNRSNIYLTMVNGKVLYQDREFKTIDIEKVKFHADRIKNEKLAKLK